MGKAQSKASKNDECEDEELQEVKRVIEEKGVIGAQEMMRQKLERWRDVKVKIGVTGNSGVGKSSFINAFRGIDDDDEEEGAAKTGYVETTSKPASYSYPDNPQIILMDLPGIGTPRFPDLDTYCDKVVLETYDTFLILTATRFTQYDLVLAKKIKSLGKSFFLIRTKIDQDAANEKRKKKHDVEEMLKGIRADCYKNVKDLIIREDEIFLISNHDIDKWDFSRLVVAILEKLPTHQKEALTLSLRILSEDVVRRKVEVFRSQLWRISYIFLATFLIDLAALPINFIFMMVGDFKDTFARFQHDLPQTDFDKFDASSQPAVSKEDSDESDHNLLEGIAPVGVASIPIALAIIGRKREFYRSQLGLPEKDSDEFKMLKPVFQKRMKMFLIPI